MLVHATDPTCYLIEMTDIHPDTSSALVRQHLTLLQTMVDWLDTYISRPHPDLGRAGDICPFTRVAVAHNFLWMTIYDGPIDITTCTTVIERYRAWFQELAPPGEVENEWKTILILFPTLSDAEATQFLPAINTLVKPTLLNTKMISSSFYPLSEQPGHRNPNFRSHIAPIPLWIFRNLSHTELLGLTGAEELQAFLATFSVDDLPKRHRASIKEVATKYHVDLPVQQEGQM